MVAVRARPRSSEGSTLSRLTAGAPPPSQATAITSYISCDMLDACTSLQLARKLSRVQFTSLDSVFHSGQAIFGKSVAGSVRCAIVTGAVAIVIRRP